MFQLVYDFVVSKIENMKSDNNKYVNRALRTALGVLFTLQLVSTLERQVFDFLGFMWAPIIGNFFQMFIVGLGIVGAFNLSRTLIIVYATWNLLWLGWNIFVICLYLEVGILNRNRERYILTIGSEGKSWWLEHGIGCEVTNTTEVNQQRSSLSDTSVVGCILQYYYVEVIHAAVQCLLSLFGFVASCVCIHFFEEQENSGKSSDSAPSTGPGLGLSCLCPSAWRTSRFKNTSKFLRKPRSQRSPSASSLDFHLPSLPHLDFPRSPDDHVNCPFEWYRIRSSERTLSGRSSSMAFLTLPAVPSKLHQDPPSWTLARKHLTCTTFFSCGNKSRFRLGAETDSPEESLDEESEERRSTLWRRNKTEGGSCQQNAVSEPWNEQHLGSDTDNDVWLVQTEV